MVLSTAVPKDRKRRRRQRTAAAAPATTTSPTTATKLPRVTTAPASLPTPKGSATLSKRAPPSTPNPLTDNSDLEAQISTLSLIQTHGYGPVPGTPMLRGKSSHASTGADSFRIMSGARDGANTDDAAVGQGNSAAAAAARGNTGGSSSGHKRTANVWSRASSRASIREPWLGPMDSAVGQIRGHHHVPREKEGGGPLPDALGSPPVETIERDEFKATKARREAVARGRALLSQLTRVLHRRDLDTAAQLLKSARAEFRAAGDANGAAEVDAALIRIKADIVVQATRAARESRDYDHVQQLMFEVLHYFSVLVHLGQVDRHDTLCTSERRDEERRMYERFRNPGRLCREYALEDGLKARDAAAALIGKRKYAEARLRLAEGRACFEWAGHAGSELRELQRVLDELEVRENSTCGDRLAEEVANKLHFLTPKDYASLFSGISKAATAYSVAHDHQGEQVVRLVTARLAAIQSAERSWLDLVGALKERRYSAAASLLREAKRYVADATKGVPFASPSLARVARVLSPAGGLMPLEIIAELAALDGLKDHAKCVQALDQGLLDKAQQLNISAREVFEFVARCCRCIGSGGDGGGDAGGAAKTEAIGVGASGTAGSSGVGNASDGVDSPAIMQATADLVGTVAGPRAAEQAASTGTTGGDSVSPGEKSGSAIHFAASDEQLSEGVALLHKIRRTTSTPAQVDGGTTTSKSRTLPHPGARHRVEDLLDEVSETEDVIIRNNALERGDHLMSLFWSAVKTNITPVTTNVEGTKSAASTASSPDAKNKHMGIMAAASVVKLTRLAHDEDSGIEGGDLRPEIAEKCLGLLTQAKEAYEGQGFAQQAERATRLRAGIIADRCLAKAPVLAPTAIATATATIPPSTTTKIAASGLEEGPDTWLSGGDSGARGPADDFEAARAAAREAEDNYTRAGNAGGALRARRTELSLRGDEAAAAVAPLLLKREYEGALEGLHLARRLYTEAGYQGAQGLAKTQDPEGLVKGRAMRDGRRLKAEAVRVLRDRDVTTSTRLCRQAQRCFLFVDRERLAGATADVEAAVSMVTHLASGDAVMAEAESALADGEGEIAAKFLRDAKAIYHDAQLSYQNLVDQVTTLFEDRPDDPEAVREAMELQDNINSLYDSRRDGQRTMEVEARLDCLAADASLENLAQVVDHDQFQDARTLLSSSALVYERSSDQERLSKVGRITSLVDLVEKSSSALQECRYAEAETLVEECLQERSALASLQPLSLRPLDCKLLQITESSSDGGEGKGGGRGGAKRAVLSHALAAGNADRVAALASLEEGDFEAAKVAAASASSRITWWASHGGGNDGESDAEGHDNLDDDRRAVVRRVEELTATVAAAAGKARAEGRTIEARGLKAIGDFAGAMTALSVAAKLFFGAGLAARAAAARAEADQTQAEELILLAEGLHGEGKFENIAEKLETAEALLQAAIDATDVATPATSAPLTEGSAIRGVKNFDGGGADGSGNIVEPVEGPQTILDDVYKFRSRVAGDIVLRGVGTALDGRDYDLALRLMLEANVHYAGAGAGRWVASAVGGGGKHNNSSNTGVVLVSPKDVIVKRAAQDGERLRTDAVLAIQKENNPAKSRELLSMAEACLAWAGVDPVAAGAAAVAKDIHIFESRAAGDEVCKEVISPIQRRESGPAIDMLETALGKYRQGDAFKQIADTRAVMFCIEREATLCRDVTSAVTSRDPAGALRILEESRPVFEVAATMRSTVLQDVAGLMAVKHEHITVLSTICRAWMQCVNGVKEDAPNPATVKDAALEDLRALASSKAASTLNISYEILQDACGSVTAVVAPASASVVALGRQPAAVCVSAEDDEDRTVGNALAGGDEDEALADSEADREETCGGVRGGDGGGNDDGNTTPRNEGDSNSVAIDETNTTNNAAKKVEEEETAVCRNTDSRTENEINGGYGGATTITFGDGVALQQEVGDGESSTLSFLMDDSISDNNQTDGDTSNNVAAGFSTGGSDVRRLDGVNGGSEPSPAMVPSGGTDSLPGRDTVDSNNDGTGAIAVIGRETKTKTSNENDEDSSSLASLDTQQRRTILSDKEDDRLGGEGSNDHVVPGCEDGGDGGNDGGSDVAVGGKLPVASGSVEVSDNIKGTAAAAILADSTTAGWTHGTDIGLTGENGLVGGGGGGKDNLSISTKSSSRECQSPIVVDSTVNGTTIGDEGRKGSYLRPTAAIEISTGGKGVLDRGYGGGTEAPPDPLPPPGASVDATIGEQVSGGSPSALGAYEGLLDSLVSNDISTSLADPTLPLQGSLVEAAASTTASAVAEDEDISYDLDDSFGSDSEKDIDGGDLASAPGGDVPEQHHAVDNVSTGDAKECEAATLCNTNTEHSAAVGLDESKPAKVSLPGEVERSSLQVDADFPDDIDKPGNADDYSSDVGASTTCSESRHSSSSSSSSSRSAALEDGDNRITRSSSSDLPSYDSDDESTEQLTTISSPANTAPAVAVADDGPAVGEPDSIDGRTMSGLSDSCSPTINNSGDPSAGSHSVQSYPAKSVAQEEVVETDTDNKGHVGDEPIGAVAACEEPGQRPTAEIPPSQTIEQPKKWDAAELQMREDGVDMATVHDTVAAHNVDAQVPQVRLMDDANSNAAASPEYTNQATPSEEKLLPAGVFDDDHRSAHSYLEGNGGSSGVAAEEKVEAGDHQAYGPGEPSGRGGDDAGDAERDGQSDEEQGRGGFDNAVASGGGGDTSDIETPGLERTASKKSVLESIDTTVDVEDLQARFSSMLCSFGSRPTSPVNGTSADNVAAAVAANTVTYQSFADPTLYAEQNEEKVNATVDSWNDAEAEYTGQEGDEYNLHSAVGENKEAHEGAPQASQPLVDNRPNTGNTQLIDAVGGDDGGSGTIEALLSYEDGIAASGAVTVPQDGGGDTDWHYGEGEEQYEAAYDMVDDASLSHSPPRLDTSAGAVAEAASLTGGTQQPLPHHDYQPGTMPESSWQLSPENDDHDINPHASYEDGGPAEAHDAVYDTDGATATVDQDLLGSAMYSATTEVEDKGFDIPDGTGSSFRNLMGSALISTAEEGEKSVSIPRQQQQHQQQQQRVEEAGEEESDDLYDIGGHDLSSDDE